MQDLFNSAIHITAMKLQQTQKVQRLGLIRTVAQNFLVAGLSFNETACPMGKYSVAEHLIDHGRQ